MVNLDVLNALLSNLPAILTALGSLVAAVVGAYVAIKQAQMHTVVTDIQAKYNADHPQSPVQ